MVPWGTLHGENPQDPHRCKGIVALGAEVASLRAELGQLRDRLAFACDAATMEPGEGDATVTVAEIRELLAAAPVPAAPRGEEAEQDFTTREEWAVWWGTADPNDADTRRHSAAPVGFVVAANEYQARAFLADDAHRSNGHALRGVARRTVGASPWRPVPATREG